MPPVSGYYIFVRTITLLELCRNNYIANGPKAARNLSVHAESAAIIVF
jgi:hypothetical protein